MYCLTRPARYGGHHLEDDMKPIVIYMPMGAGCTYAQMAQIRRRYPTAQIVGRWQDGAIMWQDAIDKK